ncbi:CPBP family intramembrane glutamic endopeptidase [Virgibacillus salexigens]|uniref:CAAX amino terminal protease self-immunity n=1 Tax=Virgibacillus massiliensis TaxID=1462526 RepID=A0A024QCF5_9BACI|nr:CPBP family intramembrane glutamic endopeptidase [Virgibacillus massiliensis]CDQ39947.1 CAAX amino terminal protease self-immunity [Virgibacillus massiliensis]
MVIGISIILGAPESVTNILQIISAWSTTLAFVILFKKIYPGLRLKDFVKEQFAPKIRLSVLSIAVIIQVIIIAVTIFLLSITNDTQNLALSFTGLGLLFFAFLDTLVRGPLGEELGWRGYALNELQKKYSPLKSALITGGLWGGWHTPLWFASGYTGMNLIKYIALFLIGIISFSIIVTLFYNLNKNLVIPIIIHQLFNFSLVLIKGDLLDILVYVMLTYFVTAIILIVINPKEVLYKKGIWN